VLMNELEGVGIRLNQKRPNITIKQRERGGVSFSCLGLRSYAQGILILFGS
jgi:ribosome-interacting GTPase 1